VAICSVDSDQVSPEIVSDGSGGAIIAWQDKRSGSYDIYAQRVNATGALQWSPSTGVPVCTAAFDQVILRWSAMEMAEPCLRGKTIAATVILTFTRRRLMHKAYRNGLQTGSACARRQPHNTVRRSSVTGSGGAIITWYDQRAGIMTSTRSE